MNAELSSVLEETLRYATPLPIPPDSCQPPNISHRCGIVQVSGADIMQQQATLVSDLSQFKESQPNNNENFNQNTEKTEGGRHASPVLPSVTMEILEDSQSSSCLSEPGFNGVQPVLIPVIENQDMSVNEPGNAHNPIMTDMQPLNFVIVSEPGAVTNSTVVEVVDSLNVDKQTPNGLDTKLYTATIVEEDRNEVTVKTEDDIMDYPPVRV